MIPTATPKQNITIRLSDKFTSAVNQLADSLYREILHQLLGTILTAESLDLGMPKLFTGEVKLPKLERNVTQLNAAYDKNGKRIPVAKKLTEEQMQCRFSDKKTGRCKKRSAGPGFGFRCTDHLRQSDRKRAKSLLKKTAAKKPQAKKA